MTSMSDATRRALIAADIARTRPIPPPPVSVALFRAPDPSPALKRELERAIAGPVVLPGSGNDNDAALIIHRTLDWQPGAEEAAEHLRAGMEQPVSRELVELWLARLAMMVANAPTDPAAIEMQCGAVWLLCGELPVAVWSGDSIKAYCDTDIYWPAPARLRQFLSSRTALLQSQLAGFEKIAKAPRIRSGPARESTVPYRPIANPAGEDRRFSEDVSAEELSEAGPHPVIQAPMLTVEQQLAALGFTRETVPTLTPRPKP